MRKQDPEKWGEKYAAVDKADFSFNGLMERTILRPFLMLLKESVAFYSFLIYYKADFDLFHQTHSRSRHHISFNVNRFTLPPL